MPVGQAPMERQRIARRLITALATDIDKVREKDRDFITSLNEQTARFTEKQMDYIVGDASGDTPKGFPSINKRYADSVGLAAGNEKSPSKISPKIPAARKAEIEAMTSDELEDELDTRYEKVNGDMAKFELDEEAVFMRKLWDKATA